MSGFEGFRVNKRARHIHFLIEKLKDELKLLINCEENRQRALDKWTRARDEGRPAPELGEMWGEYTYKDRSLEIMKTRVHEVQGEIERIASNNDLYTPGYIYPDGVGDPVNAIVETKNIPIIVYDQINSIRARRVDDATEDLMAYGARMTHAQAEELGEEAVDWLSSRLRLSLTTDDKWVIATPRRMP